MPFKDPEKRKEYIRTRNAKPKQVEIRREYYLRNKEKIKQLSKEVQERYKENRAKYGREYRLKNKERISALRRETYATKLKKDNRFVINSRVSKLIRYALKGGKQGSRWKTLVPYNLDDLISRLQKTMPEGYGWKDLGDLHIDHIIPVSKFNFEKPGDDDFRRCWALSNLQLLPAAENISKSNKLEKPFQPRLIFN